MNSSAPSIETLGPVGHPAALNRPVVRLSPKWQWRLLVVALCVVDACLLSAAFNAAYVFRFNINLPYFQIAAEPSPQRYQNLALFMTGVWLGAFALVGLY